MKAQLGRLQQQILSIQQFKQRYQYRPVNQQVRYKSSLRTEMPYHIHPYVFHQVTPDVAVFLPYKVKNLLL
jgi:hypothetical protein